MVAHASALFHGAVLVEDDEAQTDNVPTTNTDTQTTPTPVLVNVSIQAAPRTDETASQTSSTPERQCAALQTEPLDDDSPNSLKDTPMALHIDFNIQTTTKLTEHATQTENKTTTLVSSLHSPANTAMSLLTMAAQPASTTTTSSSTTTTIAPPAPNLPQIPRKR